ncbi:ISAs1 family transposase [Leptolyngbya sp. GB1-A1]|uniref:ISAs1 family transposase n=1 Tax=Leptolyngbya sp. GB1-A1 TaxID=2933908 RepID=UPI0032968CEE
MLKKTVELIRQQGNDYVIGVKANQKALYHQLQKHAQQECVFSVHLQSERTRNRQTTRIACVFPLPEEVKAIWKGAQHGVEVIRQGTRQGLLYQEQRYYMTSWTQSAEALQTRIRAHWGIENPLHWVKDVVLGEDQSSIATKPAAALMAVIRNLVITVFRRAGHGSITAAIDRFSNDLTQLLPMLDFPSG